MGAGWCPPGMLGIASAARRRSVVLAKEIAENPTCTSYRARAEEADREGRWSSTRGQCARHRRAGLGGLSTVLDVKTRIPTRTRLQPGNDYQLRGQRATRTHARRIGRGRSIRRSLAGARSALAQAPAHARRTSTVKPRGSHVIARRDAPAHGRMPPARRAQRLPTTRRAARSSPTAGLPQSVSISRPGTRCATGDGSRRAHPSTGWTSSRAPDAASRVGRI